jgi:hypothetical protein
MHFFDLVFWQQLVANVIATFIAVALGVPVALWLSRWQSSDTEKEKKHKILSLVLEELGSNSIAETNWRTGNQDDMQTGTLYLKLHTEVWQAFSDGGELQWIKDLDLVYSVADTYAKISAVQSLSEKFLDARSLGQVGIMDITHGIHEELKNAAIAANAGIVDTVSRIAMALPHTGDDLKIEPRFPSTRIPNIFKR